MFFRTAAVLLENEANVKHESIKFALFKLMAHPTKRFQLYVRATTALLHALLTYDHAAAPVAELLAVMATQYDCVKVTGDLCREIGRLSGADLDKDRGGAKALSTFLLELASRQPRLVFGQLAVLMAHLDGEVPSPVVVCHLRLAFCVRAGFCPQIFHSSRGYHDCPCLCVLICTARVVGVF